MAEKHHLTGVLAACPPDRSHDIVALTSRREQVQGGIELLVYRYNELADRKLRGPGTRSKMRDLREQIGERSKGLDRLATELDDARSGMSEREQFQTDHSHEAGFLDAVDYELDRQLRSRAWQVAADPTDDVCAHEIFGPVVVVRGFTDVKAALAEANDSHYGLQAAIFTKDIDVALWAAQGLDYGGVLINEVPTWRADHMPYGGLRDSGNTREGPGWAIREMTEERLVVIKLGPGPE